jgi:hypothetical protein
MSAPKRLKKIVELAQGEGWTYDETKDGHPRLSPPAGMTDPYRDGRLAAPVVFGKTPSDHRGDANMVAILRRLGVPIPRK